MLNSIRSRLFASYILVIFVCLFFIGVSLLFFLRSNSIVERLDYTRLTEAVRTAVRSGLPARTATLDDLKTYAARFAANEGIRVLFVDPTGAVLVDSAVLSGAVAAGDVPKVSGLTLGGLELRRATVRDSSRQAWVLAYRAAGPSGWFVAFARPRTAPLDFLRDSLLAPLGQAAAVGIGLSVVLSLLITQWVTRPLQNVAKAASAIARGNFDQIAPVSGPTEVRSLAQSFNDMAGRVKGSQLAQSDFVANISHELKTPLTSIQGFSQAILDGAATEPEAVRRAARIINDETERMRRLVEGLLDLARLDAGQAAVNRAPTDLAAILRSTAEKLSLRAAESRVTLRTAIGPLPTLVADGDRLAQVFTNLLDNALRHTPAGGTVTLAAHVNNGAGGGVEITVTDTGTGIPAEDLPRIFERFYRVDKSRAATKGYGLGLTISKEIVQAHKGVISAESVVNLGTKFTVRLPAAQSTDTTVVRRKT
ncbi:MAG: HAMP domain-containing histidine kinase [Chloroflexi bacterium]|nr:HAMP domain-containing histidine kinase [Chloroflexota bacterium]